VPKHPKPPSAPSRTPEPPPNVDDPEQSRRFIDMAREVEADESPGALDRAFERVIPTKRRSPRGSSASNEADPK
jgi:hypothetical protein